MKRVLFIVILLFGILEFTTNAYAVLYDDFSGTFIDKTKWKWGEWVREIDNGKLILKHGSHNPDTASSFPYSTINNLQFYNPDSVNSIQAEVTILSNQITGISYTRARLEGRWYNDGSAGGGMTGDIWAEVSIRGAPGRLFARWSIAKSLNAEGTSWMDLGGGDFSTPVTIGGTYTLYIKYDSLSHQFIFRIESEEKTFGPAGLPPRVGNANSPYKALSTRVQIDNPSSSAYISATFDNVYKNESPYDDFNSPSIDSNKWNNYEFAREISGGKLRSKVRSSIAYTSSVSSSMEFVHSMLIRKIQARITLLDYQNPQELYQRVHVSGAFYNDGTGSPETGRIGDIGAQVRIGGTGSSPIAEWRVWRWVDSAGNVTETLAGGRFNIPVTMNTPYLISVEWDGNRIVMRFENEVAYYTPTTNITPPYVPWKEISIRIYPESNKKEATLEALYDDVEVEYIKNYDDFSKLSIDKSKWNRGEWVREIDTVSQKLKMKQASPNPVVATSFPYTETNWLNFIDPESLNSIQADVAIVSSNIINQGFTRARISGRWYNDGTPGEGMTGDIFASVELRAGPTGLSAHCGVTKMTNADGSTYQDIAWRTFNTVPDIGVSHPLFISFNGTDTFTFKIGSETIILGLAEGIPIKVAPTKMPWKGIGTRTHINGGASSAYISATFDNVYKNGVLYDDFASPVIDPAKWTNYEFVREVSGGKLRSKVRSSTASTSNISNRLEFLNPSSINSIKAKVTPVSRENSSGIESVSSYIGGIFYNDGTPGGGYIGDVLASVGIGRSGVTPIAGWTLFKFTDTTGTEIMEFANGTFTVPVTPGNEYDLFIKWDGGKFIFKVNNEVAEYTPTTTINPPNNPRRELATIIRNPEGKEGSIEVLFDDVEVNLTLRKIVDFEGDGRTDIAVWRPESGYWYILRSSDQQISWTQWGSGSLNDRPISQ
ncbi:MAG: hypothetical protein ABIL70_09500 [candidate division WOR-3 bacterium]